MNSNLITLSTIDKLPQETIGQDVLRYIGLQDVLGKEKDTLLYFIGKQMARRFEINNLEDLIYLFYTLRWGKLELIKEKKKSLTFHLMSDDIVERMNTSLDIDFRLEAGFIAETITFLMERPCECVETINERLFRAEFKIHYLD